MQKLKSTIHKYDIKVELARNIKNLREFRQNLQTEDYPTEEVEIDGIKSLIEYHDVFLVNYKEVQFYDFFIKSILSIDAKTFKSMLPKKFKDINENDQVAFILYKGEII